VRVFSLRANENRRNAMNGGTVSNVWAPRVLSVVRIIAAFMLMQHGGQKLFGFPPSAHPMPHPLPPLMLVAGVLEFFGGLLVLLGLFTRPVAFILAGEMAVAFFMAHLPRGFWTANNMGEPAVLNCFIFLYLAIVGGGVWSIDYLRRRGG
jgi:putative oxidoreductase